MAPRLQRLQQRADVDLGAHGPEAGDAGAGRRQGRLAQHVLGEAFPGNGAVERGSTDQRRATGLRLALGEQHRAPVGDARRRVHLGLGHRCGATLAVGVLSSQGLLLQVGTRYPDQDPGRASSQEMLIGPGDV